jgi:hypothetical protein
VETSTKEFDSGRPANLSMFALRWDCTNGLSDHPSLSLSLQERLSDHGLDIACMCAPWLFTVGFAAAVAAMLFKLLQLNK